MINLKKENDEENIDNDEMIDDADDTTQLYIVSIINRAPH